MTGANEGVVDTNIFIHAHVNDALTQECRDFLSALARGSLQARLEPLVVHELTYALPRVAKQLSRADVAAYLLLVLDWRGIRGERPVMRGTLRRWGQTPGLGFVDAYLAVIASQRFCPVYTKNVRDFAGQGVDVPTTLPAGAD